MVERSSELGQSREAREDWGRRGDVAENGSTHIGWAWCVEPPKRRL